MKAFLKKKSVSAVCDVDRLHLEAAKGLAEKQQGKPVEAYGDYRKLLESKNVDAVVVATPDHWHTLASADACAAGKDVYCEKPLTLTIAEGRTLVKVVRKYNRILQTGSQQRSSPEFRSAVEMIRTGKIGKIQSVKVGIPGVNWDDAKLADAKDEAPPPELDYDLWLGPAPQRPYNKARVHYFFRFFWDYSGGQMTNWSAHHLDIAEWGLDLDHSGPIEIEGNAEYDEKRRFEVPVRCLLHYRYANGVTLTLEEKGEKTGTTFIGERGTIHVNRGKLALDGADIKPLPDAEIQHVYVSKEHHENWLECIKTRKLPICDVEIGHRSATACHLGNLALRSGKKIVWDPAKEEILGNSEAAQMLARPYRAPWKLPQV